MLMMEDVGWILFRERQGDSRRGVLTFQVPEKKRVKLNSYVKRCLNGNCWLESRENGEGRAQTLL